MTLALEDSKVLKEHLNNHYHLISYLLIYLTQEFFLSWSEGEDLEELYNLIKWDLYLLIKEDENFSKYDQAALDILDDIKTIYIKAISPLLKRHKEFVSIKTAILKPYGLFVLVMEKK